MRVRLEILRTGKKDLKSLRLCELMGFSRGNGLGVSGSQKSSLEGRSRRRWPSSQPSVFCAKALWVGLLCHEEGEKLQTARRQVRGMDETG